MFQWSRYLSTAPAWSVFALRRAITANASVVVAAAIAFAAPSAARADKWLIDRSASVVRFTYDHFGLSRQSGEIRDMEGRLDFSPTEPERGVVEVVMNAAGIRTGNAALDRLLHSPDFFDAKRHPTITFKSIAVTKTGERTGQLQGQLTMLGVTQPVALAVKWNYTGEYPLSSINPAYIGKWVSGFSARTTIARSRWGMMRGIPLLSDELEIAIEVEFVRSDPN